MYSFIFYMHTSHFYIIGDCFIIDKIMKMSNRDTNSFKIPYFKLYYLLYLRNKILDTDIKVSARFAGSW